MKCYLTPSKVAVLALVDVYMRRLVASNSAVEVLTLIFNLIDNGPGVEASSLNLRIKVSTTKIDVLLALLDACKSVERRSVGDLMLSVVWGWNGVDALDDLFDDMAKMVNAPVAAGLTRSSPIGRYIRKCCASYAELEFADRLQLWRAFEAYRSSSYQPWAACRPPRNQGQGADAPRWSQSNTVINLERLESKSRIADGDTETLVKFSLSRLQMLGTIVAPDMLSKIRQWIIDTRKTELQGLLYFLRFFHYWRRGQFSAAKGNLQRYFDHSIKKPGSDSKNQYQYALLHMSVLLADFEKWEESVDVMGDCIATAREHQDAACLNFALSWLIYLRQVHPKDNDKPLTYLAKLLGGGEGLPDEFLFLKTKARDGQHWSLLIGTLLEEAKHQAHQGGNIAKAFDFITQANYLNIQHGARIFMPAVAVFQGAAFERIGQGQLATRYYDSVNAIHQKHSPLNDSSRAANRIAWSLARVGEYDGAIVHLNHQRKAVRGILRLEQRNEAWRLLIMLLKALHHENLPAAEHILYELRPYCAFAEPEIAFEMELMDVLHSQRTNRGAEFLDKAMGVIDNLHLINKRSDLARHSYLLLLKHQIHKAPTYTNHGFSLAIRAVGIALQTSVVPVVIEALTALGIGLMKFPEPKASEDLIVAIIPLAFESCDVFNVAECFLILGDAVVCLAEELDPPARMRAFRTAAGFFKRSRSLFSKVQSYAGQRKCLTREVRLAELLYDGQALAALFQSTEKLEMTRSNNQLQIPDSSELFGDIEDMTN